MPTRMNPQVSARMLERDLENYGTSLLGHDGWRSLKTDPVRNREWGKGFGELGMADRLYIRYGINKAPGECQADVLWVEWKRIPPGHKAATKAAQHQQDWITLERARGALVWLAGENFEATPEGFSKYYLASGLNRRIIEKANA